MHLSTAYLLYFSEKKSEIKVDVWCFAAHINLSSLTLLE